MEMTKSNLPLEFKTENLFIEFQQVDKRLIHITLILAHFVKYRFGKNLVITSVYRKDNPNSVHYHHRGVDARSWIFTHTELEEMSNFINTNFPYNKGNFKTFLHHKTKTGVFHIHLQVKAV